MTATTTDKDWCSQCKLPLSECRPDKRHPRAVRLRTDMWADAERVARTDRTSLVEEMLAVRLGYLRCERCDHRSPDAPGIPVEFGDLTGRPLGEWIREAAGRVARQHPDHQPIVIGAESGARREVPRKRVKAASPVAAGDPRTATVAHLRDKIKEAETRPAEARAVRFEAPPPADPAENSVEVPDHGSKRGRRP